MPNYFFVHDAAAFQGRYQPALAAAWRRRSFGPCLPLAADLAAAVRAFGDRYRAGPEEPVLLRLRPDFPFDRAIWRLLVGEVLLYGAADVPDIQTAPDTLGCLLCPDRFREGETSRERFAPVQQAHFGTRDLVLGGGYYRPEQAGWNDREDVARLAAYLDAIDPGQWAPAALTPLPNLGSEEERVEELAFAREWFAVLRDLYRAARGQGRVIVCETIP